MGKKISARELRAQLGSWLDQLEDGQSHFIIERNSREVAVLLSMEKFRDIMQMLEVLTTLDFIDMGAIELGQDFVDDDLEPEAAPDLTVLKSLSDGTAAEPVSHRPRPHPGESIEDMAAKLGIRVIK